MIESLIVATMSSCVAFLGFIKKPSNESDRKFDCSNNVIIFGVNSLVNCHGLDCFFVCLFFYFYFCILYFLPNSNKEIIIIIIIVLHF